MAFEHYQRLFHAGAIEGSAASGTDPIRRMADAFTQLMFELPTDEQGDLLVGDFMIAVDTVAEGLTYGTGLGMFPAKEMYTSTEWKQVSVGGVAEGGYTYSVLAPFVAGLPLVVVYVATAGFGLVFSTFLEDANPLEVAAATPEEFIAAVERDFGFRPRGWVFEGKAARRVGRSPALMSSNCWDSLLACPLAGTLRS